MHPASHAQWYVCSVLCGQAKILTLFLLVFGWVGRVPLACILLTSLLKADMSESRVCGRAPEPPVKASSKCSAMKGVPFPFCGGGTFCARGSKPSFMFFIPPSTSSRESTAPQLARDRFIHNYVNDNWSRGPQTTSAIFLQGVVSDSGAPCWLGLQLLQQIIRQQKLKGLTSFSLFTNHKCARSYRTNLLL